MGIIEGILYMIWRGIAIGVIISAPMGPVGILCVQRTLDKGRKTGLYTGIGAAISDLLYCLLTGFGLSFIEEFIERNSNILQLVGSVVLIVFGIYLFKSNPSRNLKRPDRQASRPGKNILNGFLFTFSNPLIIFLIIGLFARFNFLLPEIRFYQYLIGFASIFVGALLWWYIVTYFVDRVRSHFNLRSMWLINKIIGSVIFLFAIVGIVTAASGLASGAVRHYKSLNSRNGFGEFQQATDSDGRLIIKGVSSEPVRRMVSCGFLNDFEIGFRARNSKNKQKYKFPWWGIVLKGDEGEAHIKIITNDDRYQSDRDPEVRIIFEENGKKRVEKSLTGGIDMFDGWNAFDLRYIGGTLSMDCGNRRYENILRSHPLAFHVDSIGWEAAPFGSLEIDNIEMYSESRPGKMPEAGYADASELKKMFADSEDELEGVWTELDRSFDTSFLRPGGTYAIAVRHREGLNYDVVYLSGATVESSGWETGMKKGELRITPIEGIYSVSWTDAGFQEIEEEMKAQVEDGVLRIAMPTLNSEIRFAKVRPERYPIIFGDSLPTARSSASAGGSASEASAKTSAAETPVAAAA